MLKHFQILFLMLCAELQEQFQNFPTQFETIAVPHLLKVFNSFIFFCNFDISALLFLKRSPSHVNGMLFIVVRHTHIINLIQTYCLFLNLFFRSILHHIDIISLTYIIKPLTNLYRANIYMPGVKHKSTRKRCEIWSMTSFWCLYC